MQHQNDSYERDAAHVAAQLTHYLEQAYQRRRPVINQKSLARIISELELDKWVHQGGMTGDSLHHFVEKYLATTTCLHHPGYLAHQVAVPHPAGSIGALIDALTNNAMAIYEMGPGAASIEFFVINWLLQKVGWQPDLLGNDKNPNGTIGGGVLTHGGSLANLTALTAARSRLVPEVWVAGTPSDLAIMTTAGGHYSVARAAGILGIGSRAIYEIPVDEHGRLIPARLPEVYQRLRADGRRAMALVANACGTAVGTYDPLPEVGRFCRQHDIWLHVDGAHGAGALFTETYRYLMRGIELADSLTWDAHKLMHTPTLCAAILMRDRQTLDQAFHQEASYLFHAKDQPGIDFVHRTVECTKAGLGLRFFMVLAALGEKQLAQTITAQFKMARSAYDLIRSQEDFQCPLKPQSNILCFRLCGDDALQLRVRARLLDQGTHYISTTEFQGRRYLRLVFMNPSTTLNDIKDLLEQLRYIAREHCE